MKDTLDTTGKFSDTILGFFRDRFASPMYFYFTIAWLITNWKFVFAIFMIDQDRLFISKVDYLSGFYSWNFWSISKLVLIPAISSFLAVWFLSVLAEKFYEKNYQYKKNKERIRRKIDYRESISEKIEKKNIRDQEIKVASDEEDSVEYSINNIFNEYYDSERENIVIDDVSYLPSQVLFDTDRDRYHEMFLEYETEKESRVQAFVNSGSFANTHSATAYLDQFKDDLTSNQVERIFEALDSNSQIIDDEDVVELIKFLYEKQENNVSIESANIAQKFITK